MLGDCNLSVGLAMARKACSLMIESEAPVSTCLTVIIGLTFPGKVNRV